jgi:hypothetical protein
MTQNDKDDLVQFIIFVVFGIIFSVCIYFDKKNDPEPEVYRYEVVDKTTEIDSHYNLFFGKYRTTTDNVMVVKDLETGKIFKTEVADDTYYRFNKGQRFNTNRKLFPK